MSEGGHSHLQQFVFSYVFLLQHKFTCVLFCRGFLNVQHHWHTARNEAIANGGKESGALDSVPAKQVRPLS